MPVIWAKYGNLLAQCKWFRVTFGNHGKNLVISRWPRDKAKINGVAAKRHKPVPKFFECKNPLEKFSPRFFGINNASSSFHILQRIKLLTLSTTHHCLSKWRLFWEKNSTWSSAGNCFLHDNASDHQKLQNKEQASLGFQYHDRPPYESYPTSSNCHLISELKKIENCHSWSDKEFLASPACRFKGQNSEFFEWLRKVRATG